MISEKSTRYHFKLYNIFTVNIINVLLKKNANEILLQVVIQLILHSVAEDYLLLGFENDIQELVQKQPN